MPARRLRAFVFSALCALLVFDALPIHRNIVGESHVVEAQRGGTRSGVGRRSTTRQRSRPRPGAATSTRLHRDKAYRRQFLQQLRATRNGSLPHGFQNRGAFTAFGKQLHDGLGGAGHRDARAYLAGSAVSGKNFRTGKAFDSGRTSDLDVAIVSPRLFAQATQLGIGLRGQSSRTARLRREQVSTLGLGTLDQSLSGRANRKVTFMIYSSVDALAARGQPFQAIPR